MISCVVTIYACNSTATTVPQSAVPVFIVPCLRFRYQLGVTTLLGVIPDSNVEESQLDLQPTLQIIVDQLKLLEQHGLEVYDAFKQERFACYVKLVQVRHPQLCCSLRACLSYPCNCAAKVACAT